MKNKNIKDAYVTSLEKNSHSFTISYLFSQLMKLNINPENIYIKSVDSNQSHSNMIHSAEIDGDNVYISLNMGLNSAQSGIKSFSSLALLLEDNLYVSLIDSWLRSSIYFLHPELNMEYHELFNSAIHSQIHNIISKSQLHVQFGYVLSEYHFSITIENNNQQINYEPVVLGTAKLKSKGSYIGNIRDCNVKIIINIYCEEPILNTSDLIKRVMIRWVDRYKMLWQGYQLLIIQNIIGISNSFFLPNKLSNNNLLNSPKRLLAIVKL